MKITLALFVYSVVLVCLYAFIIMISHGVYLRYINTARSEFKTVEQMLECTSPAPAPKIISWPAIGWTMLIFLWPLGGSLIRANLPNDSAKEIGMSAWFAVGAFILGKMIVGTMLSNEEIKFLGWKRSELLVYGKLYIRESKADLVKNFLVQSVLIAALSILISYLVPSLERALQSIMSYSRTDFPGCRQGPDMPFAVYLVWTYLFLSRWFAHLTYIIPSP